MNRAQGFSLIEMLVVMTIAALVVSVVTLSTGSLSALFGDGREGSAETFADELMMMMATASSEAILGGEPLALGFGSSAVQHDDTVAVTWLRYGRGAGGPAAGRRPVWQAVSPQTGLRDLPLPAGISSELSVEGELLSAQVLFESSGLPALVFYPTGETTAFDWALSQGEQTVTLSNTDSGEITRRQL